MDVYIIEWNFLVQERYLENDEEAQSVNLLSYNKLIIQ